MISIKLFCQLRFYQSNKPFLPTWLPHLVTADSGVVGAVFPTILGVWADGWNVQSFLLRTRANYYTAPHEVPLSLDPTEHGGSVLAGSTAKLVSLGLQFVPFGLILGKMAEYMNEVPVAYFGTLNKYSNQLPGLRKQASVADNRLMFEPPNTLEGMLDRPLFVLFKPIASLLNFLLFCLMMSQACNAWEDDTGEIMIMVIIVLKCFIFFMWRVKFIIKGDANWSKEQVAERITHLTEDRDHRHRQEIIFLDEVARHVREEDDHHIKPFLPSRDERMRSDVAAACFTLVKYCSWWETRYIKVAKRLIVVLPDGNAGMQRVSDIVGLIGGLVIFAFGAVLLSSALFAPAHPFQ